MRHQMRSVLIAACLLVLCTVVFGQVDDLARVTRPAENETVSAGAAYEIVWLPDPAHAGTATLLLELFGAATNQSSSPIVDDVEYLVGHYNWSVGGQFHAERYRIMIVLDKNASILTFSAPFYISSPEAAPAPSPAPSPAPQPGRSGLSDGNLAGIAAGSAVAVLVVACSFWLYKYNKRQTAKRLAAHQAYLRAHPEPAHDDAQPAYQGQAPWTEYTTQPSPVQYKPDDLQEIHVVDSFMEPVELPAEIYRRSEETSHVERTRSIRLGD